MDPYKHHTDYTAWESFEAFLKCAAIGLIGMFILYVLGHMLVAVFKFLLF